MRFQVFAVRLPKGIGIGVGADDLPASLSDDAVDRWQSFGFAGDFIHPDKPELGIQFPETVGAGLGKILESSLAFLQPAIRFDALGDVVGNTQIIERSSGLVADGRHLQLAPAQATVFATPPH